MITILSRLFIKQKSEKEQRGAYGILCSIVGICLNILLFIGKYIAGVVSGSVAITADAFNNLSDAGSSFVALIGFWFAGKEPDAEHPFGHGRFEYIAGFVVSIAILLMGIELMKSSVGKIIHPVSLDTGSFSFVVLIVSILVKLYMAYYNNSIGKRIQSSAMKAVAKDSLSDVSATSVVLLSLLVFKYGNYNVDGYGGVIVALFILYTGYEAVRDTIDPLLGLPPDPEFVKQVEEIALSHDLILGIHDLVVHDYGPDRLMISLHAEVPGDRNMFEVHEMIDHVEHELKEVLHCESVIHMDPVRMDDEETESMREQILSMIQREMDKRITIHDFRIVACESHTNLIFDAVIPYEMKMSEKELKKRIEQLVEGIEGDYRAVVDIDRCEVR